MAEKIFSAMSSEDSADDKKNGECISNSKTPWMVEKASDVVEKPVKVSKQDAFEMGKLVCPVVIEMYAEGLKNLVEQMPFISSRYTVNT